MNGLQIIVHLPLFNSKIPANAFAFLEGLIQIANFEFAPEGYTDYFLDLPESEPYNEQLEAVGYTSIYPLQNMASDFFILKVLVL